LADVDPDLVPQQPGSRNGPVVPVVEVAARARPDAVESVVRDLSRGLVLKGCLLREVRAGTAAIAEIVGPGDILLDHTVEADGLLPTTIGWRVLERTLIVDLGAVTEADAMMQLGLLDAVARRLQTQAARAGIRCALESLIRVDLRLLAYLWHLADSFGVVTVAGVKLDLPLTHALLAELIGARRPTVTTAFGALVAGGYIERDGHSIILLGDPVWALEDASS
jgi:CRP/FNR family transcriptional regulator, cyclic AMP receptor protein